MIRKIYISNILLLVFFLLTTNPLYSQILPKELREKVEQYESKAKTFESQKNEKDAATHYIKIAYIYWEAKVFRNAADYFKKAIPYHKSSAKGKKGIKALRALYLNIGVVYSEMQQMNKALDYFTLALETAQKLDKKEIASSLLDVATILESVGRYQKSVQKADEALKIAQEIEDIYLLRTCYKILSQDYEKLGDQKRYQENYGYYITYDRLIENKEKQDQISKEQEKTRKSELDVALKDLESKEKTIEIEQKKRELEIQSDSTQQALKLAQEEKLKNDILEKEKLIKEAQIREGNASLKQAETIRRSIIGALLSFVLIAALLFRGYRMKRRDNALLELQNVEIARQRDDIISKSLELESALEQIKDQNINITKSINYAQRIQRAMLLDISDLTALLPESFILLKPRDIVSGDFYFFAHLDGTSEYHIQEHISMNKIVIAAVDCTGHGVPGAFMSMIGFNILEEIIKKGGSNSNKILEDLHMGVKNSLKQDITENRDGMDVALCVIDIDNKQIEFSGAKNPVVYVQNGELLVIKGDSSPIGGLQTEKERKFKKTIIPLTTITTLYLFSDGFIDQFGGKEGKKFMSKKFRDFLLEIHERPMIEQKEILYLTFEAWKGEDYKQVDDVLVIGFRVDPDNLLEIKKEPPIEMIDI